MRERVTLVFPRFRYPSGDFSLGLASIAGYLKAKLPDAEVSCIDTTFNPSLGYVGKRLAATRPDVVGIYAGTLMYGDVLKVAEMAKASGAMVVVGGPHATVLPETLVCHPAIDVVCLGEGEETMKEVVDARFGRGELGAVQGIWYRKGSEAIRNPRRPPVADLDLLPPPDVSIFDVETYIRHFMQLDSYNPRLRGISTIVTRGCPFCCTFCQPTLDELFGRRFRIRSPESVVGELTRLKETYRLDAVYFQDDTLFVSKPWLRRLSRLLAERGTGLLWACNARADQVDEETLAAMKGAGLVKIKIGIEALSDRIRNGIYRKGISRAQIGEAITMAKDLGIQVAGFFMLGAPTESEEEIRQTIRFASRSTLVEANFAVTVPLPGTSLHDTAREMGWPMPDDWSRYDYYHASGRPKHRGALSSWSLEWYKRAAVALFYFRPKRLLATVRSLAGGNPLRKLLIKVRRA